MDSIDYIHSMYDKICVAYGQGDDENGISAIDRLKNSRTKVGRMMPEMNILEKKFLQHDCAFISAERSEKNGGTEGINAKNTKELHDKLLALKKNGVLDFFESQGYYKEIGDDEGKIDESGFFCADYGPQDATQFFTIMYQLAEYYHQDSFLFKSAGGRLTRTGYYVATNKASQAAYQDGYWPAGELYLGLPPNGYFSKSESAFGNRRIFFRETKPTKEELEYSQNYK